MENKLADNIFYQNAFILCNVIQDAEGNAKLDIPFPTYHQTIVENGKQHYCYLTNDLIGKKVLVYIHYAIADEDKITQFSGYLGNDWKNARKDSKAIKHWKITKADALATIVKDKDNPELDVTTKYDGIDKDDIIHPYAAEDVHFKK